MEPFSTFAVGSLGGYLLAAVIVYALNRALQ